MIILGQGFNGEATGASGSRRGGKIQSMIILSTPRPCLHCSMMSLNVISSRSTSDDDRTSPTTADWEVDTTAWSWKKPMLAKGPCSAYRPGLTASCGTETTLTLFACSISVRFRTVADAVRHDADANGARAVPSLEDGVEAVQLAVDVAAVAPLVAVPRVQSHRVIVGGLVK